MCGTFSRPDPVNTRDNTLSDAGGTQHHAMNIRYLKPSGKALPALTFFYPIHIISREFPCRPRTFIRVPTVCFMMVKQISHGSYHPTTFVFFIT
jgi:hypothetical protein